MKKIFSFVCLFALLSPAFMQESEQSLFDRGVAAYRRADYSQAQDTFFKMLQAYPQGKLKTVTKLMLGKAYYKQGDYSTAQIVCRNFFDNHPQSSYMDDIRHLYASSFFNTGQHQEAVEEWLWVVYNSKDPRLRKIAGNYVFRTMDQYFSEKEVRALEQKYQDNIFNGLVTILRSKKLMETAQELRGRSLLKKFLREEPNHFYADDARRLLGETPATVVSDNNFIYFKPLEGDLKEIGDQIENGMRYAIMEYQTRNEGAEVNFQPVELEESVARALLVGSQKINNSKPLCLVGPIDADQSAALSLLSRYEQRPYIVPLSSEVGFTELSPYTFQLTPDVETQGRFLGEYAVQKLGLKKLAVLAPVNNYGRGFAQSFIEAVQANGGEIVSDQWYYVGTQDFSRQFKAIRKQSFFMEFKKQQGDLDTTLSEAAIQNRFRQFMEEKFDDVEFGKDSTQIPARGIEGVLILATPQYIPYLAPQFAFHNIDCVPLGNEGWNDPDQLQKFRQYVDGLIYITSRYYDKESWNYKEFMNRYRLQMHETPELYHLLGYDIMKWILQNYRAGISPEELKERLEGASLYQGILENIKFSNKPRVNDQLKVMKFSVGQIVRLN